MNTRTCPLTDEQRKKGILCRSMHCEKCKSVRASREGKVSITIDEAIEIVNQANIQVSDSWFNERCENCNKDIMASIHHFVDSFYKNIIAELNGLKKQDGKKDS